MTYPVDIGFDVGGTSTRLLAQVHTSNTPLARDGPGANPQRIGIEAAAHRLARLIKEVLPTADAVPRCIVAGVAGAGRPADQHALSDALKKALGTTPPPTIAITHDAALTLDAAVGNEPGIVIIAGTGSVVLGRMTSGERVRAGGWGFLLGDEGSGYALGLSGLRSVARAFDGGAQTQLTRLLREEYQVATPEDLIDTVYADDWPIQNVARLVLRAADAGDAVATQLLRDQTHQLASQAERVASRAAISTGRIVLWGGLTREPTYSNSLTRALFDLLPDARISALCRTPVEEALRQAIARSEASGRF
jgi:N-acetylglucosamine kinase-like BadF-type ATPase